jgi:hypothetical protein
MLQEVTQANHDITITSAQLAEVFRGVNLWSYTRAYDGAQVIYTDNIPKTSRNRELRDIWKRVERCIDGSIAQLLQVQDDRCTRYIIIINKGA